MANQPPPNPMRTSTRATGMVIEKRLYMLDQRLPVLTINSWKNYRHLKGKLDMLENGSIHSVDPKTFLSRTIDQSVDIQRLADKITELLKKYVAFW